MSRLTIRQLVAWSKAGGASLRSFEEAAGEAWRRREQSAFGPEEALQAMEGFRRQVVQLPAPRRGGVVTRPDILGIIALVEANSYRRLEEFDQAFLHLDLAQGWFDLGSRPSQLAGDRLSLLGSLHRDLWKLREAEEYLRGALELAGDCSWLVPRVRAKLGDVIRLQGRPAEGAQWTAKALPGFADNPLYSRHLQVSLALALAESGAGQEAAQTVRHAEGARSPDDPPYLTAQASWALGLAHKALGDQDGALEHLRMARELFAWCEDAQGYSMASLDLCLLLLEEGRTAHLAEMAREAYDILQALDVTGPALAAWQTLLIATRQENAQAATLSALRLALPRLLSEERHAH